jgi:hypothetical protein
MSLQVPHTIVLQQEQLAFRRRESGLADDAGLSILSRQIGTGNYYALNPEFMRPVLAL